MYNYLVRLERHGLNNIMIKFLIAAHGYLADGIKSTVKIIMGDESVDSVLTLNAFVNEENEDVPKEIRKHIDNLNSEDKMIIFTDLMHGSVNQFIMPYADDDRIYVITGFNFPLVCEIIAKYVYGGSQIVDIDELKRDIEKSKNEIIYVNDFIKEKKNSNEDDFFN